MGPGQDHRRRPGDAAGPRVQRLSTLLVPPERILRWFANFEARHGAFVLAVRAGALEATAADGTQARARLPFDRPYSGPTTVDGLLRAAAVVPRWGVLLVRKGGFAVAAGQGAQPEVTKVGRRHVQGRTKAGGQSQQRFARRRDNQAREAYAAAADHAHRVLATEFGGIAALVCGGDRSAVDAVLDDRRLHGLATVRCGPWLDVPDPRRDVLGSAIARALSLAVEVRSPDQAAGPPGR